MDKDTLRRLLLDLQEGRVTLEALQERLTGPAGLDLGFAHLDMQRPLRTGIPEVVYGAGKSAAQLVTLLTHLHERGQTAIATRVDDPKAEVVRSSIPEIIDHRLARVMVWPRGVSGMRADATPKVGVLCAGTSDLPVFEEAAVVLEALGHPVRRFRDVGVAGLHRLLGHVEALSACRVLIVVAGMEGALPSVVAGLVGRPVIAVPTSVGYGAAFGGLAPLLGMLNACAPGVAVVNIDNGFGAAAMAALLLRDQEQDA